MAEELSEDFLMLSDKLVAASIRRELPGRAVERQLSGLTSRDYIRLVNEAARLALSEEPGARTIAYEIATHALALSKGDKTLVRAVEFILARLGNFPGQQLLRTRYRAALAEASPTPSALTFEAFGHEYDNTIESSAGQTLKLTDFQIDLFDAMENTSAVSVSAPTSAGKSFILSLQILRRLRTTEQAAVVYIVPTRALIREVILRLRQALQRADMLEVALRSVPQPVSREEAPRGVVYVLTQERLLSLLLAADEDFWLTMMVIDEAQGVRDGGRGVLLQTAVHAVLRRFPNAECVFASPLINNPQYLLDLFGREGSARHERHSPVAQSFIVVSPSAQDSGHAQFSLLRRGNIVRLAVRDLGFDFSATDYLKRRAQLAFSVTAERDACLVYANGAWEAEATAEALAALRSDREPPREVQEFITYIEQNIHPGYGLLSALKRGVGFHHGEMPASVRAGVEDLFRDRKLQFVCCTGTLLQGVNLPARHLVVERPRRGNGQPMEAADLLNLAGRAGRLRREFHGNVWCLRPEFWPKKPRDRAELPDVVSALETTMLDGGTTIQRVLDGQTDADPDGAATAAIGHLLTEYIQTQRVPDFRLNPDADKELQRTMAALRDLPLVLPSEIFKRNGGILPMRLENLHSVLVVEADLDDWLPMAPFEKGFYHRLLSIFELLHRELHGKRTIEYKFDAWLASRWVHQDTLQQIIESSLTWRTSQGLPTDVRETIRKLIRRIEQWIRYRWVRSLRAYHDVLGFVLRSNDRSQEADNLRPLYLYVEYGAYDRPILSLISLGFSRTAALILKRLVSFPSDATPETCRQVLLSRDLSAANVPKVIQREAQALLGRLRGPV